MIRDKSRKAFSLAEMLVSTLIIALVAVAAIRTLTISEQMKTGVAKDVATCIVQDNASSINTNSTACLATKEAAKNKGKVAITSLLAYTDTANSQQVDAAMNIIKLACDEGGREACDVLVDRCIANTAHCDVSGKNYDVQHYLDLNRTTNNPGKAYIFKRLKDDLNDKIPHVVDEIVDICTRDSNTAWGDLNLACNLLPSEVYNFDVGKRSEFFEQDSNYGTTFRDGRAYLMPPEAFPVKAYCWGDNVAGQLGDGTTINRLLPVTVDHSKAFKMITTSTVIANRYHTCALDYKGQAWCWGNNQYGQLGNGTRTSSTVPVKVSGNHIFKHISAGSYHSCAIDIENKAWCWGYNRDSVWNSLVGQLGSTGYNYRTVPTAVNGDHEFTMITAGMAHTCALDPSGKAWCWGDERHGRLGNGQTYETGPPPRPDPIKVLDDRTFKNIDAGFYSTFAIDTAGLAWSWGAGHYGILGYGGFTKQGRPTAVRRDFGQVYESISSQNAHTCALETNGQAWCWGYNVDGQLGRGFMSSQEITPGRVLQGGAGRPAAFKYLDTGGFQACGVDVNEQTWCWGNNPSGGIGNNTTTKSSVPRLVDSGDQNLSSVACGRFHACGLGIPSDNQAYVTTTDNNNITKATKVIKLSIVQDAPGVSDIKWIVSFDGRATWSHYYNGSWQTATNDLENFNWSRWNTAAGLQVQLPQINSLPNGKLDFAFQLSTPNNTDVPYVDEISVIYY